MSHVSRFRSRLFLMLRVRIDHLANKRAYLSVPVKPWPVFWLLNILVKCQVTKYHEKSDGDINWWHYVRTVKGETVFQRPFDRILVNSLWLIIYDSFVEKVFGCHTLLFDRALFSLCNISSNIEKTEDNSLFGVKLLIHHWTSNLHDADYESTTMKARIQTWSEERGQIMST